MEARLTEISENEALLYMGYRGGALGPEQQAQLDRCRRAVENAARPRAVIREFPWDPEGPLAGSDLTLEGRDVRALLRDCRSVILFGVTLGSEVERLIRRTQVSDMADAFVMDCCASAAVENVCDNLCQELSAEGGFFTDRFSPGYGDLPFSQQPDFCRVLDLPRRIGVTLTEGGLMVPQKSVTALVGRADTPQKKRFRGCASCGMFRDCQYRKEMRSCGRE